MFLMGILRRDERVIAPGPTPTILRALRILVVYRFSHLNLGGVAGWSIYGI